MASFPLDGKDVDGLMEMADRRLYRAKESGRDRVIASEEFEEHPPVGESQ